MTIASPCVKICLLDAERRYCTGCYRTVQEIAGWARMSDAEREQVLGLLPDRQSRLTAA